MKEEHLHKLLGMLPQVSTIAEAQEFLRSKECAFSGTWAKIVEERMPGALSENKVSKEEIFSFFHDAEENKPQHVFLYSIAAGTAKKIISDRNGLADALKKHGAKSALKGNPAITTPQDLSLSAIRRTLIDDDEVLTLKFLETRRSRDRIEFFVNGDIETIKYKLVDHRVVSSVRIRSSGIVEVRIGSGGKGGSKYEKELKELLQEAGKYVNVRGFNLYSLTNFKQEINDNLDNYKGRIKLRTVAVRNDQDIVVTGNSGVDSPGIDGDALEALSRLATSGGHHDHSRVEFVIEHDVHDAEEVSVNFRGDAHEFSFTKQISAAQYEYILAFIREATKNFSGRS